MTSPQLNLALAQARIDDFRRAAEARRAAHGQTQPARSVVAEKSVTLRFGSAGDEGALAQLAALDSSKRLAQPVLLADADWQLLAALSLPDGTVIADPFQRTADLIDLLRARARQLDGHNRIRRCGRLRSWARLCPPTCREPETTPAGTTQAPSGSAVSHAASPVLASVIERVRSAASR